MTVFFKNWKTSTVGIVLIGVGITLLFVPGLVRILAAIGFVLAGVGMIFGTDANKAEQYIQELVDKVKGVDFESLVKSGEKK